jgi:hypothetical protein
LSQPPRGSRTQVVRSEDGRVGVVHVADDGSASFSEVTNPRRQKGWTGRDSIPLPTNEFEEIFPTKEETQEPQQPGTTEAARNLFLDDYRKELAYADSEDTDSSAQTRDTMSAGLGRSPADEPASGASEARTEIKTARGEATSEEGSSEVEGTAREGSNPALAGSGDPAQAEATRQPSERLKALQAELEEVERQMKALPRYEAEMLELMEKRRDLEEQIEVEPHREPLVKFVGDRLREGVIPDYVYNAFIGHDPELMTRPTVPPTEAELREVENYKSGLNTKRTPANEAWGQYEIKHTGPLNHRIVLANGKHLWIDGSDGLTMLEAKHVEKPEESLYIAGSKVDPDFRSVRDIELVRQMLNYKKAMKQKSIPFKYLRIITNHEGAADYFRGLLLRYNIPGEVVVRD